MRFHRSLQTPLALALVAGCMETGDPLGTQEQSVQNAPMFVEGNPTCADLGMGSYAFKVDPPSSGTYGLDASLGGTSTVTVSIHGLTLDWSATLGMDAVIVKGGPNANLYTYVPEALSNTGETSLHAPANDSNGTYYGLSHIDFCFDYEVVVDKTATPSFERSYSWSLDKASSVTALTLSDGEVYNIPYTVTTDVAGHVDADFRIGGVVTIHNPSPFEATLTAIDDALAGVPVTLDCGVSLPYALAPNGTLTCPYDLSVDSPVTRTNEVDVSTTGIVGPGSASAVADFANATMREVDECVTVNDDHTGALGGACVGTAPHTFSYTYAAGPYECGGTTLVNVATFETNDTHATGSDNWTVAINVPCEQGCTLTPGYWKTHSSFGPAPYDDTWAALSSGANTAFYLSGKTYYQVLWTPPNGNAYYILAHAFIGAQLNSLDGASFVAAQAAYDEAAGIFSLYTPSYIAIMKGANGNWLRGRMIQLAGILDQYNRGLIGPGHCDE